MAQSGLMIHVGDRLLVGYCGDLEKAIGNMHVALPKAWCKIAVEVKKILPDEAVEDLPVPIRESYFAVKNAHEEWIRASEAYYKAFAARKNVYEAWRNIIFKKEPTEWIWAEQAWFHANSALEKPNTDRGDATDAWFKAYSAYGNACKKWDDADKDKFHAKWCGCPYWNGEYLDLLKEA